MKISFTVLFIVISLISACSTQSKKARIQKSSEAIISQPTNTPQIIPNLEIKKEAPEISAIEIGTPVNENKTEVTEKKKPVFGLILGPGSALAFSHIGFLKEFGKSKIPIKAIFGYEIGALAGALFSKSAESFEAEWQFSKIGDEDWIPKKNFFSVGQNKPQDIEKFDLFLQNSFSNLNFEDFKVKFGCSTLHLKSNKLNRIYSGKAVTNLKQCLALPPLLSNELSFFAGIGQLTEVIEDMRRQGINHIIFVNPLSLESGDLNLHWNTVYQYIQSYKSLVDTFVDVPTRGGALLSVDKKNDLIRAGSQSAKKAIDQIRDLYQF